MNCFTHDDKPAVAMCKVCCKGLCKPCASLGAHGVTCAGACQAKLDEIMQRARAATERGKAALDITAKARWTQVFTYAAFGVIILSGAGVSYSRSGHLDSQTVISLSLGALFIVLAVRTSFIASKHRG